ncbi:hypothetical protein [Streptomyces sp. NPDC047024]|uniref:hypothetical protein n=1 Tax=Streptomyces sp. NPDC047024 TaxID=3155476 RepID=UPI0033E8A228
MVFPFKKAKERVRWVLDPLSGVGPLRFGMSPDEVSAALGGAVAHSSYNLGGGIGWGSYLLIGVTAIHGEDSGLVGVRIHASHGPQVALRGVELIARRPSEVRAALHQLALHEGVALGVNWSGDPETVAWGLSMRTMQYKDSVVTDALLVSPELAADPYRSEPIVQWCGARDVESNPGAWPVLADRDRSRWEWTPLKKIGPLEFGMSPRQVAAALGGEDPTDRSGRYPFGEPWEGTGQWWLQTERFDKTGVTVHYTYCDGLPAMGAVQVHGRTGPQVDFAGIKLIGAKPSLVEAALTQYGDDHGFELVLSSSGWGPEELKVFVGATRAGDDAISEARFCAPEWYDEG